VATVRKRQLPSGETRWQADYVDATGKRRSKQFERRKDADAYLVKVRGDLQRGLHVAPGASITVSKAGELWLERGQLNRLTTSTVKQYEDHLAHIEPELGRIRLSELTAPRIAEFADALLAKLSHKTAAKVLTSLRSIIKEAMRRGLASHNPADAIKVRQPRDDAEEAEPLEMPSKAELKAIINGVTGRWRPLIITAVFTGMRGSELRGLQWQDIDLKAAVVKVRRRADAWDVMGPPKSKAGRRDIPVPPIVVQTLREWKLACPQGEANNLGLAFPAPSGGVLSHSCILKDGFGPLQIELGITMPGTKGKPVARYGLHALRHAAVSLWIEQGLQPKRIQQLAGHSSIRMTFDVYGHLFKSEAEDEAAMREIEARLLR
jgi:integrase